MDSSSRLDYVLFHLTPTRTRCDLVIFAGKLNEKLAHGLLEPFVTHLRSAKDQISKGGYSVTLQPPSPGNSHWFTKGTLQRFVRFVSTPEVLERFVTIEREISQLENSIKSFEASNADGETEGNVDGGNSKTTAASIKSYGDSNENGDLPQEESSKARLNRVVETRKVVLRKEQAMVYARALAAGFEMDNLNAALLFSDAFGASRLREACINFRDLCKKKNEDRLWVDEIAAMQAMMPADLSFMGSSGIILAGEDNDPLTGGKNSGGTDDSITSHGSSDAIQENGVSASQTPEQMQNQWANQFSQYLRNFQGPMYQQMPPYQGYGYPGMQAPPHYYPSNISAADRDSHERHDRKSSSKKKSKASKARGLENEEQDRMSESSESGSETDSTSDRSHRKKSGKKSSRKVVIRNINYISSIRDADEDSDCDSETDSLDEEDSLNGNSLKQQLKDAVGSFEKHQKSTYRRHRKHKGPKESNSVNDSSDHNGNKGNGGWDAFQQLLLKDDSETDVPEAKTSQVEEEILNKKLSEDQHSSGLTPGTENITKQKPAADDAFLMMEKETGFNGSSGKLSDESFKHSKGYQPVIKKGSTSEEFLFPKRTEDSENHARVSLSDDAASSTVIKNHTSDDWFVSKQSSETVNQEENGHLRFTDGDYLTSSTDQVEKRNKDAVIDDSLMIHGRLVDYHSESQRCTDIMEESFVEKAATEAIPQKQSESQGYYEPDELYMVLDRDTVVEQTVPSWSPEIDFENAPTTKETEILAGGDLTSSEKGPTNKKTGASVTKTSSRDARSRIPNGPMRRGKPETNPGPQRSTFGSKTTAPKSEFEKEEARRKRMEELLIRREKRIAERDGGGPVSSTSRKPVTNEQSQETKKPKPILRSSTIERLAAAKKTPNSLNAQPKRESKVKGVSVNNRR